MDRFCLEPVSLLGSYYFLPGGGDLFVWGTRIFRMVKVTKGGGYFFNEPKRGLESFYVCKGGQKKLATGHHKDTVPFLVKNDGSLRSLSCTDV